MDHQQTVKIDNYKSQYNKIISNITEKNTQLESVLEEVLKASTSLAFNQSEMIKAQERLAVVRANMTEVEDRQRSTDQKLNTKEASLIQKEQELDLEAQVIAGKKTEREIQEDNYIAERQVELKILGNEVIVTEGKIETNKMLLEDSIKAKDNLDKEIKSVRNKRRADEIVLEQNIKDLETSKNSKIKQIDSIDKEIEGLNIKVAEAIEKTRLPNRLLAEREIRTKEKEQNLEILVGRWRKFHAELFPGQEMKL